MGQSSNFSSLSSKIFLRQLEFFFFFFSLRKGIRADLSYSIFIEPIDQLLRLRSEKRNFFLNSSSLYLNFVLHSLFPLREIIKSEHFLNFLYVLFFFLRAKITRIQKEGAQHKRRGMVNECLTT